MPVRSAGVDRAGSNTQEQTMTTHQITLTNLIHTVHRTVTHARRENDTNNNLLLEHWLMTGNAVMVPDNEVNFCLDTPGEFETMVQEWTS